VRWSHPLGCPEWQSCSDVILEYRCCHCWMNQNVTVFTAVYSCLSLCNPEVCCMRRVVQIYTNIHSHTGTQRCSPNIESDPDSQLLTFHFARMLHFPVIQWQVNGFTVNEITVWWFFIFCLIEEKPKFVFGNHTVTVLRKGSVALCLLLMAEP
jgi:hypothetical protein